MITINLQNIEDLLFRNQEIKQLFPDLRHIFDQWLLSYRIPALRNMRKQAVIDLLNSLNGNHIEKLSEILKDMVFVEPLNNKLVKHFSFSINDCIPDELKFDNLAITRKYDQVYITTWR